MTILLMQRKQRLINTDPQRRCYNGCHFSSALVWTNWEVFDRPKTQEIGEEKLKFWNDLNEYAVSQRGESARCEYKLIQESMA